MDFFTYALVSICMGYWISILALVVHDNVDVLLTSVLKTSLCSSQPYHCSTKSCDCLSFGFYIKLEPFSVARPAFWNLLLLPSLCSSAIWSQLKPYLLPVFPLGSKKRT